MKTVRLFQGNTSRLKNESLGKEKRSAEAFWAKVQIISKTSFEKKLFFCVGEYAEYGFDQQRLIWYVHRLWDMVSRLFRRRANAQNVS